MSKIKMIVTTLIAVLAFSALASASASAATAGWMVGGTQLTTTAALATTAQVDESGTLTVPSSKVTIECKGNTLNGLAPQIESAGTDNKGSASSLEFTGCKSTTSTCTIASEKIGTVPINAEATLEGTLGVKVIFTPKTTKVFTTIEYIGSECSLAGIKPVKGKATVKAPTGQDENTLQLIEAATGAGELEVGSSEAQLKGSALLKLASGLPWSFL
jgi:hypothetical protein